MNEKHAERKNTTCRVTMFLFTKYFFCTFKKKNLTKKLNESPKNNKFNERKFFFFFLLIPLTNFYKISNFSQIFFEKSWKHSATSLIFTIFHTFLWIWRYFNDFLALEKFSPFFQTPKKPLNFMNFYGKTMTNDLLDFFRFFTDIFDN